MKYFARHIFSDGVYEITIGLAEKIYIEAAGKGKKNIIALPQFHKGIPQIAHGSRIRVWGENISNKECFKRRIQGTLRNTIFDEACNITSLDSAKAK